MVSKERFLDLTIEWALGAVLLFLGFHNQRDTLFFPLAFLPIIMIGGIFGVFLFISLGRIERNTTLSRQFLQPVFFSSRDL